MTARIQEWRLRTPEGVSFSFRLASPVLRSAALFIDLCVIAAGWSLLGALVMILHLLGRDLAGFAQVLGYFILSQGYRMAAEWLWGGQTLGKRVLRLRVMDERGYRLTFAQVVLRNLLRFVDSLPGAYLVGGVAALVSSKGQRLGDLAAGTVVVWEPRELVPNLEAIRPEKYNSLRGHPSVVARLRQAVTPTQARAAWQALVRRERFEPEARVRLFSRLAEEFRSLTPIPPEAAEGVSDEQFVRNVVDILFGASAGSGPAKKPTSDESGGPVRAGV